MQFRFPSVNTTASCVVLQTCMLWSLGSGLVIIHQQLSLYCMYISLHVIAMLQVKMVDSMLCSRECVCNVCNAGGRSCHLWICFRLENSVPCIIPLWWCVFLKMLSYIDWLSGRNIPSTHSGVYFNRETGYLEWFAANFYPLIRYWKKCISPKYMISWINCSQCGEKES